VKVEAEVLATPVYLLFFFRSLNVSLTEKKIIEMPKEKEIIRK